MNDSNSVIRLVIFFVIVYLQPPSLYCLHTVLFVSGMIFAPKATLRWFVVDVHKITFEHPMKVYIKLYLSLLWTRWSPTYYFHYCTLKCHRENCWTAAATWNPFISDDWMNSLSLHTSRYRKLKTHSIRLEKFRKKKIIIPNCAFLWTSQCTQ